MLHRSTESRNFYTVLRLPRHGDLQTPTFLRGRGCDATISWYAHTPKRLTPRDELAFDWDTFQGLIVYGVPVLHVELRGAWPWKRYHVPLRDMAVLGELVKHDGGLFVRFSARLLRPGVVNLDWAKLWEREKAVTL